MVSRKSIATIGTHPVGIGPFQFGNWVKGSSLTLTKWDGYRDAAAIKLKKVTFRFISDPAAQTAGLLAGDLDAFPRFESVQSVSQFQHDPRFTVEVGDQSAKTMVVINNRRKPFDDVRVRRAIAYAINKKAVVDGAQRGFGVPIGSHSTPIEPGYVNLGQC